MLLLSGVVDEVVPREHMQALWDVVEKKQGTKVADGDGDDESKQGGGQVGHGKSKFVEFYMGSHSESELSFASAMWSLIGWSLI